ncbi:MAG: phosphatidylserine decarboxylase [Acidobacteria bacterium]|nr:phosphatidylserine decarboxylase [Acidobacteriota bacterium]
MKIAPQGLPYAGLLLGVGLLLILYPPSRWVSLPFFALGIFVLYFFRDPERRPPADPRLLVSPADGTVVYAGKIRGQPATGSQVSIFLSILDVHINRSPLSATVGRVAYTPGRFFPAYREEASRSNEQNEILLKDGSFEVTVRQIAGVVARRIVCSTKPGARVERGERIGLIQFGSRVEVILPDSVRLRVGPGQHVRGGETVLAERP